MHNKECRKCYYFLGNTCRYAPPTPIAPLKLFQEGKEYAISVYPYVRSFSIGCGKFKHLEEKQNGRS